MLIAPHHALQSRCVLPSAVIVAVSQPCVLSGAGLNCQATCTLLTYQPLDPSVPVIFGLTETEPVWPPAAAGTARQARANKRSNSQRFAVVTLGTPSSSPV